jgi:4-amino-4-deoxy-L-arabinose transferase-like glycosyltransferase
MRAVEGTRPTVRWTERVSAYSISAANRLFLIAVVLVVVLHGIVFFVTMVVSPIGFDEAFNLQAPLNLVQGNGYSTEDWLYGGPRIIFDAIVSTGPLVEVPIAVSFALFGTSIEAARIVMLPFYALLLSCLFILGRRIGGRWIGLVTVLVVLALNTRADWAFTVIYGPSDALGEYAAAGFIALALVLLPRHRALSGLAIGFAAIAKFIAFMAAPAFVIALLLIPVVAGRTAPWRERIVELVRFATLVVAPSAAWELVKLISLGPASYLEALRDYLRFLFRSGSGIDGSGRVFFLERLSRLFAAWHLPTLLVIIAGVVLFAFAALGLWRYWARRAAPDTAVRAGPIAGLFRFVRSIPVDVLAALGTLAVFTIWWSFIASSTFVRHTMPVLIALVPIVAALAISGALWLASRSQTGRVAAGVFAAGFAVILAVQGSLTVASSFRAEDWTRAQQNDAAQFISDLGVDEVQGIGWWAAPEVRFLSHVPSTPVGTGDGPLVLEPILRELDPATYQLGLDLCVDVLYDADGFVVCTIDPATEPLAVRPD